MGEWAGGDRVSDMVWGLEVFSICNGELLEIVEYGRCVFFQGTSTSLTTRSHLVCCILVLYWYSWITQAPRHQTVITCGSTISIKESKFYFTLFLPQISCLW